MRSPHLFKRVALSWLLLASTTACDAAITVDAPPPSRTTPQADATSDIVPPETLTLGYPEPPAALVLSARLRLLSQLDAGQSVDLLRGEARETCALPTTITVDLEEDARVRWTHGTSLDEALGRLGEVLGTMPQLGTLQALGEHLGEAPGEALQRMLGAADRPVVLLLVEHQTITEHVKVSTRCPVEGVSSAVEFRERCGTHHVNSGSRAVYSLLAIPTEALRPRELAILRAHDLDGLEDTLSAIQAHMRREGVAPRFHALLPGDLSTLTGSPDDGTLTLEALTRGYRAALERLSVRGADARLDPLAGITINRQLNPHDKHLRNMCRVGDMCEYGFEQQASQLPLNKLHTLLAAYEKGRQLLITPTRISPIDRSTPRLDAETLEALTRATNTLGECLRRGGGLDQRLDACADQLDTLQQCTGCSQLTGCEAETLKSARSTLEQGVHLAPHALALYTQPIRFEARGRQRVEGPPIDEALCFLTHIQGAFRGGGESVKVTHDGSEDARWVLEVRQGDTRGADDVRAAMTCTPRGLFLDANSPTPRAQERFEQWRATDRLKELEVSRSPGDILLLTGVQGALRNTRASLNIDELRPDGETLTLTTMLTRPFEDYPSPVSSGLIGFTLGASSYWSAPDLLTLTHTLARADEGFCFFTGLNGGLETGKDSVSLHVEQGRWVVRLTGGCLEHNRSGECTSVRRVGAQFSCKPYLRTR